MTATLLHFNNYFDRVYRNIGRYMTDIDGNIIIHTQPKNDFNPNDGVNTAAVFNVPSEDEGKANYVVLSEGNDIISRWFIIDNRRTRLNQYEVTLRRDLLADYFNDIINAPSFIEKATVRYGNPLLFNSEDMSFNQIKSNEIELRDKTGCPWIVGYINKEVPSTQITAPVKGSYYAEVASFNDLPYYQLLNEQQKFITSDVSTFAAQLRYSDGLTRQTAYEAVFNTAGLVSHKNLGFNVLYNEIFTTGDYLATWNADNAYSPIAASGSEFLTQNKGLFDTGVASGAGVNVSADVRNFLKEYSTEGRIYKVGNGFYRIRRDSGVSSTKLYTPLANEATYDLFVDMVDSMPSVLLRNRGLDVNYVINFGVQYTETVYTLFFESVALTAEYKTTIPGNRNHLNDAPYDMFAIPYNIDTRFAINNGGSYEIANTDSDAGMAIATKIAEQLGNTQLYDLQLLPYCPFREMIKTALTEIDINGFVADTDYSYITKTVGTTNRNVGIVLWCQKSDFAFTIDKNYVPDTGALVAYELNLEVNEADAKVQALCDTHRLVSPNYNGQFEFNIVKNNGVSYFTVDATYKPYSPYIRVAPNFGGLYGKDYDDARGLICGGDFSLPTTTDQWKQYELNNKNYLNAFNRQIENMEINNTYQRIGELAGATAGSVQGAASVGTFGAVMTGGNPYALAGGAIAGGAVSAAGGVADFFLNEGLRREALDYTKDQFGYQLGNIRALPYSLNRVSAFNINNKIFPILEYYTCSDIEKQALRDKIKYNGMTIMTIGTVAAYLLPEESYIKARVIRLPELDNHTSNEIAIEMNKGFFIQEINN